MAELTTEERARAQAALDAFNAKLKAEGKDAFDLEAEQQQAAWDKTGEIHKDKALYGENA